MNLSLPTMEITYVILAFFALLSFSAYNVMQKIAVKYLVDDSFVFSFYYYLFALMFFLPMILMGEVAVPTTAQLPNIALNGLIRTIVFVTYLWSFRRLDVTVISSMFNLRVIVVSLIEVIFLGTIFSLAQYGWMVVLILGGILLSMDEKFNPRSFFKPAMLVVFLVILMSAGQYLVMSRGLAMTDLWTFNFWSFVFSLIGLVPFLLIQKKDLRLPRKSIGLLAVIASLFLLGVLFESKAVSFNPTGTTAIMSLPGTMILAMILTKFKPGFIENHTWQVYALRLSSVAVMAVAVWQIIK